MKKLFKGVKQIFAEEWQSLSDYEKDSAFWLVETPKADGIDGFFDLYFGNEHYGHINKNLTIEQINEYVQKLKKREWLSFLNKNEIMVDSIRGNYGVLPANQPIGRTIAYKTPKTDTSFFYEALFSCKNYEYYNGTTFQSPHIAIEDKDKGKKIAFKSGAQLEIANLLKENFKIEFFNDLVSVGVRYDGVLSASSALTYNTIVITITGVGGMNGRKSHVIYQEPIQLTRSTVFKYNGTNWEKYKIPFSKKVILRDGKKSFDIDGVGNVSKLHFHNSPMTNQYNGGVHLVDSLIFNKEIPLNASLNNLSTIFANFPLVHQSNVKGFLIKRKTNSRRCMGVGRKYGDNTKPIKHMASYKKSLIYANGQLLPYFFNQPLENGSPKSLEIYHLFDTGYRYRSPYADHAHSSYTTHVDICITACKIVKKINVQKKITEVGPKMYYRLHLGFDEYGEELPYIKGVTFLRREE